LKAYSEEFFFLRDFSRHYRYAWSSLASLAM